MANLLYCTKLLNQGDQQLQDSWTSSLVSGMWQYGIDQWIGQNEFIFGITKEERLEKITKEVNAKYAECTVRIATESGMKIATYFKCLAGNDWLKLLLENSNGCNV